MAYYYLDFFIKHNRVSPTTMYAEGNPVIESPLSFATSIHDMLLQSWGGVLRVFPAAPELWGDVAFEDLRGQGAFLVSAKKKGGVTQFVSVKSEIGTPCVVITDIPKPRIYIEGSPVYLSASADGSYRVPLKKGETVVFAPVALSQADLKVEPIPVGEKDRNLFGLNEKTTRLPGYDHYYGGSYKPATGSRPEPQAKMDLPEGRFVRIELSGEESILSLAEVEVLEGKKNVALGQKVNQSTTAYGGDAELAVDGNTDGEYNNKSVTHTAPSQNGAWWEVDLGHKVDIDRIRIYNRKGNSDRLDGFTIRILDENRKEVFSKSNCPAQDLSVF